MIKRFLTIILFLSLSLFLVMPVSANTNYDKQTAVMPEQLDYRNSLIDWFGVNVDIEIIWDQRSGGIPNNVAVQLVKESGTIFTLQTWDCADYICTLQITDNQKTLIKATIFSRTINEVEYLAIYGSHQESYFFLEFRIKFKSLLRINFGSIYIADYYSGSVSETDVEAFQKNIGFDDLSGDLITSIILDDETTQAHGSIQYASYSFINKFTNISAVYLNYWNTKETTAYSSTIYNVIYQVAIFADSQIILPDLDIDTDFQIYQPTICGVLDIACVSRNLIGEFSNNIYNQLGAEVIAGGVMVIYDTLFYPVYIVDDTNWQNGIISLYAMLVLGVLYLIVKRVLS